nr:4Fe-4S binding protein [uncultured Desulfobulbus sp.]
MDIKQVRLISFSPTGTTAIILKNIAEGIGAEQVEQMNLTLPQSAQQKTAVPAEELALIGAPVYGGRLPVDAVKRLQQIQANNTPAVLVVTYGNRAFEDALLELKELTLTLGFVPLAGAAFIGEHSFATPEVPIANGRPDSEDVEKAVDFGRRVKEHLNAVQSFKELQDVPIPGNHPYKERHSMSIAPVTHASACTLCGTCVSLCPTGAIRIDGEAVLTTTELCIRCCACIKGCPEKARIWEGRTIADIADRLHQNCSRRKEPEFFGMDAQAPIC